MNMVGNTKMSHSINAFGLTERDLFITVSALNGTIPYGEFDDHGMVTVALESITPDVLAVDVAALGDSVQWAAEEWERICPPDKWNPDEADTSELQKEIAACVERLSRLSDSQAIAVYFWVIGFYAGVSRMQEQQ